jgi:hypothetical protein
MLNNDGKISEIKTAFQSDFTGTQVGRHSKRLRTTAVRRPSPPTIRFVVHVPPVGTLDSLRSTTRSSRPRSSTADSSSSVVQSSSDVGRLPPIESHAADNPSENSKRRTRKSKSKRESNAFSATDASSAASDSQLIDRGPSDDTLDVPVVDSRQKSGSPMNDSAENSANGRPSINDPLFVYSGDGKVHGSGGQSMLRGNQLPSIQKDAVDALNDPQDGPRERKKEEKQTAIEFAVCE